MAELGPPGTAVASLDDVRGRFAAVGETHDLIARYSEYGVLLNAHGLSSDRVNEFTEILEAIVGFTAALPWLPSEIRSVRNPKSSWPTHLWLEVSAPRSHPTHAAYGRTTWDVRTLPRIGFSKNSGVLRAGTSLATTSFEATIHELGHLTMVRTGARKIIQAAGTAVFAHQPLGRFVSLYAAMTSEEEAWAEVTLAANSASAWARLPDDRSRDLIRRYVDEVNRAADVPLI